MDDGTVSSPPPSSSPTLMTPPEDLLDETGSRKMVVLYPKGNHRQLLPLYDSLADPEDTGAETPKDDQEELVAYGGSNLGNTAGQLSFSERLHHLLRAVQVQRHGSHASRPSLLSPLLATLPESGALSATSTSVCYTVSPPLSGSDPANISSLESHESIGPTTADGLTSDSQPADVRPLYLASRKRSREERPHTPIRHTSQHGSAAPASSARTQALKKCRLSSSTRRAASKGPRAEPEKATVAGLSGAFDLRYAKGAGSLRRAESLRSDVERMTERIDTGVTVATVSSVLSRTVKHSDKVLTSQELPRLVGVTPPGSNGCPPTVPTTPTARAAADRQDGLAGIPIIYPPPFELIPRGPLSAEDAAQTRILRLLENELDLRIAEGFHVEERVSNHPLKRAEDEEEQFWLDDTAECADENDVEAWLEEEKTRECRYRPRTGDMNSVPFALLPRRAGIASPTAHFGIDDEIIEECVDWIIEVMPPEEDEATHAPGDLYDVLATCPEMRFHAGHLFLRYFSLLNSPAMSLDDAEAAEAVMWDIAVACLALSIKFHRDVLYPLDVIYAHEFLDLAPHALTFDDLENAQRDVLEAVAFRVGIATPGAFMAELWAALPTLRLLLAFDGGWVGAQERAWAILCDVLQRPDALRYPISLLTASALSESLLRVLARKYNTTGRDGRARRLKNRDEQTLRKAAAKASRGVRLDIQEILGITKDESTRCQKWLGFAEV